MVDKVRENRLRRMAERQHYILEKSRRRDRRARGFGKYRLLADCREVHEPGFVGPEFTLTIEEVEQFLTGLDE